MTKDQENRDQDHRIEKMPDHKPPSEEESYPSGTAQERKEPEGTGRNKPVPGYPTP
ncbi:hypothetical protein SAMN06265221_13311 [Paracoccus laeviglucosivorans]|uniref:Uncharacterized protein n=1 Tax=Paracoccus laeviglucosivorans TaxID=1197861 RepID=A0A521FPZ1_9RHOB|nr:hypothetical protein SAMN06265221_13311 [Paracoccus laeviglucosivorans]